MLGYGMQPWPRHTFAEAWLGHGNRRHTDLSKIMQLLGAQYRAQQVIFGLQHRHSACTMLDDMRKS